MGLKDWIDLSKHKGIKLVIITLFMIVGIFVFLTLIMDFYKKWLETKISIVQYLLFIGLIILFLFILVYIIGCFKEIKQFIKGLKYIKDLGDYNNYKQKLSQLENNIEDLNNRVRLLNNEIISLRKEKNK